VQISAITKTLPSRYQAARQGAEDRARPEPGYQRLCAL